VRLLRIPTKIVLFELTFPVVDPAAVPSTNPVVAPPTAPPATPVEADELEAVELDPD